MGKQRQSRQPESSKYHYRSHKQPLQCDRICTRLQATEPYRMLSLTDWFSSWIVNSRYAGPSLPCKTPIERIADSLTIEWKC